jgi:TRAP-type C4-dicarboxylate transport system permease small subunit
MEAAGRPSSRLAAVAAVARRVIEGWALAGGLLLLAIVLLTAWSLAGDVLGGGPLPGDFEIVEVGVAVAVFSFLPYCQVTGANVTADIFTAGAGPRLKRVLGLAAAAIALGFSAFLTWRMYLGMQDYRRYEEVTTIYQFPIWQAFVPILVSLVLLVVASLITLGESLRAAPPPDAPGVD